MKKVGWVIAVTWPLLGAPVLAGEKGAKECQPQKMDDLPGAVQDTLKQEASGGKIEEICKKGDKGAEVYKAEIVKGGKGTEVQVDAAGKLLEHGKTHDESKEQHHKGEGY